VITSKILRFAFLWRCGCRGGTGPNSFVIRSKALLKVLLVLGLVDKGANLGLVWVGERRVFSLHMLIGDNRLCRRAGRSGWSKREVFITCDRFVSSLVIAAIWFRLLLGLDQRSRPFIFGWSILSCNYEIFTLFTVKQFAVRFNNDAKGLTR
jgi:hypothetical protein